MMKESIAGKLGREKLIGPAGHLILAVWAITLILLVPEGIFFPLAIIVIFLLGLIYPEAIRRVTRPRLLLLIALLALPAVFLGEVDLRLFDRIPISVSGAVLGMQMCLRAIVILLAISGMTSAVGITTVAGIFERAGMQGLGFTMGVALNLLPSLRQSTANAWNSLRMRGGLKKRRWRGLQMLFITVITNALRRSEEIALAAEARAFTPEKSRPMPIERGRYDLVLLPTALVSLIIVILL